MTLTRRDLHKALVGVLLMGNTRAVAATQSPDLLTLNRLTFGATLKDRARFYARGLESWLDMELAKPVSDPALDDILERATLQIRYKAGENDAGAAWDGLDEMRGLTSLHSDPEDLLPLLDSEHPVPFAERVRPAREVIAASLIRAVHADAQLREMITSFWHEHFSVNSRKDAKAAVFFPAYDHMLRQHALGNFRVMLGKVARAPAMLSYLNNDASRASPANENFARELLELHTLGVENYYNDLYDNWHDVPKTDTGVAQGYIDQDVYEVARAFTGWSIGDGRRVSNGVNAPKTGTFHYIEGWHDPYQKRILGVEFSPNRGPMDDGEQVLDLLATHSGTANHIARKLLRRCGIEAPSTLYHAAVADSFMTHVDASDQMARVLRTLVLHPEFMSTAPSKMRRPFEYLTAIYRASGANVASPTLDFDWHLTRAGWTQHQVKPPTGHSDETADWANTRTLNGLVNLALYAHEDWLGAQSADSGSMMSGKSLDDMISRIETGFAAPSGSLAHFARVMGIEYLPDDRESRIWVVSVLHSAASLQPEFMLR